MSSIISDLQNGVLSLKLNRPDKFNSFNKEMALLLQDELDTAQNDDTIRAVYITGEGKAFCAGQDLVEALDPNVPLKNIVKEHYNPIILRLRNLQVPVVAAVNGVAAGAGANIALACDVVVAAESASFIQAFSKIGLIPDSAGTFFLPRLIGMQKASALMMLGDKISAAEAEKMGMIYKALPDENFAEASMQVALTLAQMPTKGLWYTKQLLNKTYSNTLSVQLDMEEEMQTLAGQTQDYKEGVTAFLEKRKPTFTGH
jgi:2-(1,2-epoxy-1,2-dihydrophenyl)acetyl-CoA isomerase